jgi:hypothetical protein
LHLGYNHADWGVRVGGLPESSGGIYGADVYARRPTDARGSAWYFGVGTTYWANREFFDLYVRGLVGFEWRPVPGFGLYLEYGPGVSVARQIPQGSMYLLPLAALIRFDLGMNLYF